MLTKVKTQGKGKLSPVGAGGAGEGWLTIACAPSRECIHTSEREREISSYSGKDSIGSCRVEIIAVFLARTLFPKFIMQNVY